MAKKAASKAESESAPARKTRTKVTAETLSAGQRDISVSEFFAKNRHLLGFDNPRKALLTTIKEAVDNALDACEEAHILPDITVQIEELTTPPKSAAGGGKYRVTVEDNGPGVVRKQIENIFGRLLYGSKFHRMKMSRGQQGIGISAAGMYGLMTTGRPMVITTRPKKGKPAHHIELAMDTAKNKPVVSVDVETEDFPEHTGTRVAIQLEAKYIRGKTSVDEYLEQTAIANPHARITYIPPAKSASDEQLALDEADAESAAQRDESLGTDEFGLVRTYEKDGRIVYPRTVDELPDETREIKPHPYGVELGTFLQMLAKTNEKQLGGFLKSEFCRITPAVAKEVYKAAGVSGQSWIKTVDHKAAEKIYKGLQQSKLRSPPTDCLSPIGVRQILAGLLKGVKAEFYSASTRPPAVYRGNPFQIEVGIAFGGDLSSTSEDKQPQARVIRFANRVPLLYQQSSCCSFKAVLETSWRNYGMTQPRGALPQGPLIVMIHMASVWVPFTSESKEAIADYDEIRKEMRLALQECGRKLNTYMRKRAKMRREGQRRQVFEKYIGEIVKACHAVTGAEPQPLYDALLETARKKTQVADHLLDDEGRIIKASPADDFDGDDGVIVLDESDPTPPRNPAAAGASPSKTASKRKKTKRHSAEPKKKVRKKDSGSSANRARAKTGAHASGKPRVRVNLVSADSASSTQSSLFPSD